MEISRVTCSVNVRFSDVSSIGARVYSARVVASVLFFSLDRVESILHEIDKERRALQRGRAERGKHRARKKFENVHREMSVVTMVVV